MILFQILVFVCLCSPLFLFFDYHRRSNIHYAILYVVVFVVSWMFVLKPLIDRFHIYFAMSIPFLMIIFLFIAKKRKRPGAKKKNNSSVIDDF